MGFVAGKGKIKSGACPGGRRVNVQRLSRAPYIMRRKNCLHDKRVILC